MEIDSDFLNSLNPIFRLDCVKIYWMENVLKVGQTNNLRPRLLIVASPGIFLIHKKTFPFQSKIISSISYIDLISLYIAGNCASFSSRHTQIRVKHSNIANVAFLAFFIRQMQFPTDILPINLSFSNEIDQNKIFSSQSSYHPESLFRDRLLSCIMHFNLMVTNTSLNAAKAFFPQNSFQNNHHSNSNTLIKNNHSKIHRVYTLRNDILLSPFIDAIILSLAYEQDIDTLKFKDAQLSKILPKCQSIIRYNRFIQTVCFVNSDFEKCELSFSQMLDKVHSFKPTKWVFDLCDLSKPSFLHFFDSLSKIGKPITHLHFFNCTFSNDSAFPQIFQSIFFNDCFTSIESFIMDNCKSTQGEYLDAILLNISQIFCCSWAMERKCFHHISVIDSGSEDCSGFLNQALSLDVGLDRINLNKNCFLSPISISTTKKISELSFLSLRNCRVTNKFLESMFLAMSNGCLIVHILDISSLRFLDDSGLSTFLEFLQTIECHELKTLFFDNNSMNANQSVHFVNFLKKQKKLSEISINGSIGIKESPNGILGLIQYLTQRSNEGELTTLSIQGDDSIDHSFGMLLKPLLKGISPTIQNLDITNQKVGQDGLKLIIPLIEKGQLTEIHFDGSNIQSFDFLVHFCKLVLASDKLTLATFPENDFNHIITLLISDKQNEIENTIDFLKHEFINRFHLNTANLSTILLERSASSSFTLIRSTASINGTEERKNTILKNISSPKTICRHESFYLVPESNESIMMMKGEIEELYTECIDIEETGNEPLLGLVNALENEFSLSNLLSELERNQSCQSS